MSIYPVTMEVGLNHTALSLAPLCFVRMSSVATVLGCDG